MINDQTRKIDALNIGDSRYAIYRKIKTEYELIYISEEMDHSFNMPFQVGAHGDSPDEACLKSHIVCPSDLIILATDGLWDNLEIDMITTIINQHKKELVLNTISNKLSKAAKENAFREY